MFSINFITTLNGRGITKIGGEGIRGTVIKTKEYGVVGIAQKILDGNQRANEPAIMKILNHLNLLLPKEKDTVQHYEEKQLFNHRKFHIGNITQTRFKALWESDRYWEVMSYLSTSYFNAQKMCGVLCLQHKVNEFLDGYKKGLIGLDKPTTHVKKPQHLSFI